MVRKLELEETLPNIFGLGSMSRKGSVFEYEAAAAGNATFKARQTL